ncbi:MAG: hypothetical protein IPM74_09740 [Crocinitomicaceae bacterium]|nr:hypothetical protein [Crocinitomicaceae bacterium]
MTRILYITWSIFLSTSAACSDQLSYVETEFVEKNSQTKNTTVYGNEYGEIHLTPLNDTLMFTHFLNQSGEEFDTVMTIQPNSRMLTDDGMPFLRWHMGGIKLYENCVRIFEFSSFARLAAYIQIEKMYERPFYKLGDTVIVKDEVYHPKGGQQLDGIYLDTKENYQGKFVAVKGIIQREPYPRDYYSTPDGPQGMFSDTTKIYYRLVLYPMSIDTVEKTVFTGYPMNHNGRAAFVWDFADSEIFYLNKKESWTEEELKKKITLRAVLVQYSGGTSELKSWQIIDMK